MANRWGEGVETVTDFIFLGYKITVDSDCNHEIKRCLLSGRKAMANIDTILKSRVIILPTKVFMVKAMVFPIFMYGCEELNHKQSWAPKNWCFWTVVLGKTLESPLDSKEIQPVNPKGNQPWIFIEKTGPEAEAPILWPPDVKSRFFGRDPDGGKDWGQEESRLQMPGWHHWLNALDFEQTQGDS